MSVSTFLRDDVNFTLHPAAMLLVPLWDGRTWPGWQCKGLPVFKYKFAPSGLLTRRQLRAARLCPGGQEPYALLVWRRGQRWAWLYRSDLARPKRVPSSAQLAALDKAIGARQTCRECGQRQTYCVSTADGRCAECMAAAGTGAWRWAA